MTMISLRTGVEQHPTHALFARLARWIKGALAKRRKRRDGYALERLPDRLLRDIGLERSGGPSTPVVRPGSW